MIRKIIPVNEKLVCYLQLATPVKNFGRNFQAHTVLHPHWLFPFFIDLSFFRFFFLSAFPLLFQNSSSSSLFCYVSLQVQVLWDAKSADQEIRITASDGPCYLSKLIVECELSFQTGLTFRLIQLMKKITFYSNVTDYLVVSVLSHKNCLFCFATS